MSLKHQVAAIVARDGQSSADQMLREIAGVRRSQLLSALGNARALGLVHCIARVDGDKRGQRAGIFAPGPAPKAAKKLQSHPLHSAWGAA